ncbi:hypothetical protein U1Q18_033713 [Sarracenia purpurea var. burkii]
MDIKSTSVCDAFVKEVDAKGLRNKSFPHYESWVQIFGRDTATWEIAEGPTECAKNMADDSTLAYCYIPIVDFETVDVM